MQNSSYLMSANKPMEIQYWTHRSYFKHFRLNVEQYGEILIAHAFEGEKKGDAQPCFDIEANVSNVRNQLLSSGVNLEQVESCLSCITDGKVLIEVKSKQAKGASVIHCNDNKVNGVRGHLPATHFAVMLFDEDGLAENAWFFKSNTAQQLRRKDTKSQYISVRSLRNANPMQSIDILDIHSLINKVASCNLTLET